MIKDITPKQIRKLRFDCWNMSQIEFSKSLHVCQQLVAAWENGTRRPSEYHAVVLHRIKKYLRKSEGNDERDGRLFSALRSSASMRGLEKLLVILFSEEKK